MSATTKLLSQEKHVQTLQTNGPKSACYLRVAVNIETIPARSHTLVEIDHEIISTAILLPSADLFKKGCCQLQVKVCALSTG